MVEEVEGDRIVQAPVKREHQRVSLRGNTADLPEPGAGRPEQSSPARGRWGGRERGRTRRGRKKG